MTEIFRKVKRGYYRIASVPRCLGAAALLQAIAYIVSSILIGHTGAENNSALVYMLAVSLTALLTDGYFYGILSSLLGGFCINYFFMFPYAAFSLSYAGYPVAMLSMISISCVVSALTTRVKQQAIEAARREQNTKLLYEMNTRLNEEKAAIQLEAAREAIHSNLLRAVSHDLRTPLTSISGNAGVLLNDTGTLDESHKRRKRILQTFFRQKQQDLHHQIEGSHDDEAHCLYQQGIGKQDCHGGCRPYAYAPLFPIPMFLLLLFQASRHLYHGQKSHED